MIAPRIGQRVGTPVHTLVAYTPIQAEHANGYYPNGVGIAVDPDDYLPYVVWNIFTTDEGETWVAQMGDYCRTIGEAVKWYESRGGH